MKQDELVNGVIEKMAAFVKGCSLVDDGTEVDTVAVHNSAIATVLLCLTDPQDNGEVVGAIREAILETRKQTLEEVSTYVDRMASGLFSCDLEGDAARKTTKWLAARIRTLPSPTSEPSAVEGK